MNDNEKLELFEKIMNKELAVCETCYNTFDYVRKRVFCDECLKEKRNAKARERYREKRKDPEWVKKQNAYGREARRASYYRTQRERQRKKEAKKKLTDIELLTIKIMNKELTICETCDNIFDYVRQKVFCDECMRERNKAYKRKYHEENREELNAKSSKYYEKNREKILAKQRKYQRKRYHAKKNQEEE